MDTTTTTHIYRQPFTGLAVPCQLLERVTKRGREVASIVLPAEHSRATKDGHPVPIELVVASRSVTEA